jgi:predicted MFS family arabinose efflux permease
VVRTWLALVGGVCVANVYYWQALLPAISETLRATPSGAAVAASMFPVGYAVGLLVRLPRSDRRDPVAGIGRALPVCALSAVVVAAAPNTWTLAIGAAMLGYASTAAQLAVIAAAVLAPRSRTGYAVGAVMVGVLLGVFTARVLAGWVAGETGWRTVYVIAAGLCAAMALVHRRFAPTIDTGCRSRLDLAAANRLPIGDRTLRALTLGQALLFGAFCMFWAPVGYELVSGHGLSQVGIGVFSIAALAGPVGAVLAGRLADRGRARTAMAAARIGATVALIAASAGENYLAVLVAAAVLLDLTVQTNQVLSQTEIYRVEHLPRGATTAVFQGGAFMAGATGSVLGGWLYVEWGWSTTALVAAAAPMASVVVWWTSQRHRRR